MTLRTLAYGRRGAQVSAAPPSGVDFSMHRLTRLHRGLLVVIAAAAAMLSAAQVAGAAPKEGPTVPTAIAVPDGNKVFLVGHATGVQIYTCNNGAWGPGSTPRATLVDDKNKVVATHFAG